jgi:hypothetical protein
VGFPDSGIGGDSGVPIGCVDGVFAATGFELPSDNPGVYTDVVCIDPTTSVVCDAGSDPHYLQENTGEPVIYWDGSGGELGFSIYIEPAGAGGFSEGDEIGVTSFDPPVPFPEGGQGLGIEDSDGTFTVIFETVDLSVRLQPTMALSLYISETGWEPPDWLHAWVETESTSFLLLDTQGDDIDNLGLEGIWQVLSADLNGFSSATVKVSGAFNANDERIYLDALRFDGLCPP